MPTPSPRAGLLLALAIAASPACRDGDAPDEPPTWQDEAVATWTAKLEDPDPWTRIAAAEALGALGERARPAGPLLLRLLREDPAPAVRERCALVLGRIGVKEATEALLSLVAAGEPRLGRAAAISLVDRGRGDAVLELALARLDARPSLAELNELAHVFAVLGERAVSPLRDRLQEAGDAESQRSLALCLGQLGEPARSAVPDIVRLLDLPDQEPRLAAILALSGIGGPEACRALARTVAEDPDANLRLEALINGAGTCNFQPAEAPDDSGAEAEPEPTDEPASRGGPERTD